MTRIQTRRLSKCRSRALIKHRREIAGLWELFNSTKTPEYAQSRRKFYSSIH